MSAELDDAALLADFVAELTRLAPSWTLTDLARWSPKRLMPLIQGCCVAADDDERIATRILGLILQAGADTPAPTNAATVPTLHAPATAAASPSTNAQKRGTNRQQPMAAGVQEQGGACAIPSFVILAICACRLLKLLSLPQSWQSWRASISAKRASPNPRGCGRSVLVRVRLEGAPRRAGKVQCQEQTSFEQVLWSHARSETQHI
jgi:hypothetical protein